MRIRGEVLLLGALGLLGSVGCGAPSAVNAHPESADSSGPYSATTSQPIGRPAKPAAKPSAEQIARWAIPDFEPLELLACDDDFGDFAVQCLAISPDGKQFVLGGTKLTLWNTGESQPSVELLAPYMHNEVKRPIPSVAISPDGNWIAIGDREGSVRIWTLRDQEEVISFPAHDARVAQLAFSPDSSKLATTSYSGEVALWQLPSGEKLKSLKIDKQEILRLLFLSDSLLAAAGSEASIWNVDTGQKQEALTAKYVMGPALGLSNDRRLLAFNDPDSVVRFWDVQDSKPSDRALRGAAAHLIAFSRDAKRIAVYSQDSTIRIYDAATGALLQVIDADGDRTSDLAWLPDADALLVASEGGRARIWGTQQVARDLGIEPPPSPQLAQIDAGAHRSLSSAQFQRIIDIRSLPQLPGSVPQWSEFGMCSYHVAATQSEAESFYRYCLEKAGWTEVMPSPESPGGLVFRKDDCQVNVSFTPDAGGVAGQQDALLVTVQFVGNYDVRWLPKIDPIESKNSWASMSSVSYRSKANLTDCEVALLKQFHAAGWTAYTRLDAQGSEDAKSRRITMLQGGSVLTVSIGYPADSTDELFVQVSVGVSDKSLPIPPDAGWIEFEASNDLQTVVITKLDLQQTVKFYDTEMAASGWSARESRRNFKDDKAWLTYVRGQQDIFLRLTELPTGGTRVVVGDAANSSWQLKKSLSAEEQKDNSDQDKAKTEKPGLEAADFVLPAGAKGVKFDVDQKQIEFEVAGATPQKLGDQFVAQMQSLDWKREDAGIVSDDYVFITFSKDKAEIQLRVRSDAKTAKAMLSGDGLLWDKPAPSAPARISYETWLRRNQKAATLDLLDEFAAAMHSIPTGGKSK
jgi:WD40 repeat protein